MDQIYVEHMCVQHTAPNCNKLKQTNALQHTATHCNTLHHCFALKYTATLTCRSTHRAHRRSIVRVDTHRNTLQRCNTTKHTATHATRCNTLKHAAAHGNTLQRTSVQAPTRQTDPIQPHLHDLAMHYTATQYTATQFYTYIAKYCNTLQQDTTHCNTWHHTATHCNTLQHTPAQASTSPSAAALHCQIWHHNCNGRPLGSWRLIPRYRAGNKCPVISQKYTHMCIYVCVCVI